MAIRPERTVIVGATGPTGLHLARTLVGRGWPVRAVRYDTTKLRSLFAETGGTIDLTPVEETIAATLDWIAAR